MKRLLLLLLFTPILSLAQNDTVHLIWMVGESNIAGMAPNATATVSGPEAGLTIFNTTDNVLQFYNGTTWVSVGKNITGTATLSAGTVTVATTSVTATSKVFVTVVTPGGTQGFISVPTITAGTSFVINSTSASETSTVNWWVVN